MTENIEKKKLLKINTLGHAMCDTYMFIIPLLLPLFREEFHINYVQSGLILTVHVAIRSIFSLIFGYFGDQYDKQKLIAGGFLFSSLILGILVCIQDIHFIVALLFLLAIGVSTYHPLAASIIRENSNAKERAKNYSLFGATGAIGAITSSLLFGFFVNMWGWKISLLLLSFPGYFIAYAYFKSKIGKKNIKTDVVETIKIGYLPLFFIGRSFRSLGTWAILSFLPVYATDYIGIKPEFSAWIITIFLVGELSGNLISHKIINNGQQLKTILISTIVVASLIWGITLTTQPFIIILFIITVGIVQGIYFPSQNVWLTYICPAENQSRIFGMGIFADGFASTVAPALYGWIADQTNLVNAYRIASFPVFISFIFYLLVFVLSNRNGENF